MYWPASLAWCTVIAVPMLVWPIIGQAAAAPPPSADEMVQRLSLKPNAADLAAPSRGIRAVAADSAPHEIDLEITFASGSAALAPSGVQLVGTLGHALASPALAGDSFRIEGHADTVGVASANLALSRRRAETVTAALTQHYGIAAARLTSLGVGSDHLVVPTPDQTAEPRNRVVRIINLGPTP